MRCKISLSIDIIKKQSDGNHCKIYSYILNEDVSLAIYLPYKNRGIKSLRNIFILLFFARNKRVCKSSYVLLFKIKFVSL